MPGCDRQRVGPHPNRELNDVPVIRPLIRRALERAEGFTLVEILTAMVILTVALVGVGIAVAVQSGGMAATFPIGQAAVTRGYYISAAIMLAQERLEDVTRLTYTVNRESDGTETVVTDSYGAVSTIPGFPTDSPVVGSVTFTRSVTQVVPAPFAGNIKQLIVTVTFTLPGELGSSQESVRLSSLVSARPR